MGTVCGTDSEHPKYSKNPNEIKDNSAKLATILVNFPPFELTISLTVLLTVGGRFGQLLGCGLRLRETRDFILDGASVALRPPRRAAIFLNAHYRGTTVDWRSGGGMDERIMSTTSRDGELRYSVEPTGKAPSRLPVRPWAVILASSGTRLL